MRTYTPHPKGPMPDNVGWWEDGPPFGRIALAVAYPPSDGEVVLDATTGEYFRIKTGVDCGLGCRCAAEAEWVPARPDLQKEESAE